MRFWNQWLELLEDNEKPNKFTIGMGILIRKAREEEGFCQRELARKIYRRQAALSDMENGLMEPDAETLLSLSFELRKPIIYFYPSPFKPDPIKGELTVLEKEFLLEVRKLEIDDLKRIIAQTKALADISSTS